MEPELQRFEIESGLPLDHELSVDDGALRKRFEERRFELREVTVQGLQVAALEEPLLSVPKHQYSEAVPFRLEEPRAAFGKLVDELREHRLDGRIHRKLHAEILAVLARPEGIDGKLGRGAMRIRAAILGFGALLPPLADTPRQVVEESCQVCHNDSSLAGNMSLDGFDVDAPEAAADLAEKMVRKLRAGMMPPAGVPRPDEAALEALVVQLETRLDENAARRIRTPAEGRFSASTAPSTRARIEDLLALDIEAGDYLPPDTKSANFDNIADAQMLSATLLEGYLRGASELSRLAVGDPKATAREATYKVTRWVSQTEQVEGAPYGTRGGVSVVHNFPADGHYLFRVSFHHETTGALHGSGQATLHTSSENPEQIEISIEGERAALLPIDRWMHVSDPNGVNLRTEPIFVRAGPRRVSAAFLKQFEGPVQDLIRPHDWSIASTSIADAYGMTSLPHLRDLAITGPYDPTGVSETESRRRDLPVPAGLARRGAAPAPNRSWRGWAHRRTGGLSRRATSKP